MPELPEVETTRRGVEPHVRDRIVEKLLVRDRRLRWPVPDDLGKRVVGQSIKAVRRRGKYLLFDTAAGSLLIHLGMSGSLRLLKSNLAPGAHDHIDICFDGNLLLRYTDPRRFGCCLWMEPGEQHALLRHLGPEPLSEEFDGNLMYSHSRGRKVAVKSYIMDAKVVVGVGNIYANEALFRAGIRPDRSAGRISRARYDVLASEVKQVLTSAIEQGGTTLRNFVGGDGRPGYFAQKLAVYGRAGAPCVVCGTALRESRLGQRSSVYCVTCQR